MAATPAFQRTDDRFTDEGGYGSAPFGTSAFGGPAWEPLVLPTLEAPSDDIQASRRRFAAEIVHRRNGLIIGARKLAVARKWKLKFHALTTDVLDPFIPYFEDRFFWLLPYGADGATRIFVHWVEDEFGAKLVTGSGGLYDLEFEIEEALWEPPQAI